MWVITDIDFFDFIQSEILSQNNEKDLSISKTITLVERPLIYISSF